MKRITFHWSSEIYGLGIAYRTAFRIPKCLPLPFFSDHGVIPSGHIDEAILDYPICQKTLLTFSKSVIEARNEYPSVRILGQIHPWVIYKEKMSIKKSDSPEIVIFLPLHTTSSHQVFGMNDKDSINYLKSLSEDASKIKVCLHWNDLGTEREELFQNSGFEVISFGNPMNEKFIENFYKIAIITKYAIAESWTSGVAYFVDLEIPCVILPRDFRIESNSDLNKNVDLDNPKIKSDIQYAEQMFNSFSENVTAEQRRYIQDQLGYSFRHNSPRNLRVVLLLYITALPSWLIYKVAKRIYGLIKNSCK